MQNKLLQNKFINHVLYIMQYITFSFVVIWYTPVELSGWWLLLAPVCVYAPMVTMYFLRNKSQEIQLLFKKIFKILNSALIIACLYMIANSFYINLSFDYISYFKDTTIFQKIILYTRLQLLNIDNWKDIFLISISPLIAGLVFLKSVMENDVVIFKPKDLS